ncbi:hypothetical protein JXQ70_09555 [bacterium]|nr:hypothetical protein [bacterium]
MSKHTKGGKMIALMLIVLCLGILIVIFLGFRCKPKDQVSQLDRVEYTGPKPELKQFGDLVPADFDRHPIWVNCHVIDYEQPWYQETDEETFRPWLEDSPADPSVTMFLVKARFTLADGSTLSGFLTPQLPEASETDGNLGIIQPQLFLPNGRLVSFWFGIMSPAQEYLDQFYAELGKSQDQIFPISFSAEEHLATGIVTGQIPGFCSQAKNATIMVKK